LSLAETLGVTKLITITAVFYPAKDLPRC